MLANNNEFHGTMKWLIHLSHFQQFVYSIANIIASTSTPSFSFYDSFMSPLSHSCPLLLTLCPLLRSPDLPAAIKSHLITVAYHVTNGRQSNDENCTSIKAMAFSGGYAFSLLFSFFSISASYYANYLNKKCKKKEAFLLLVVTLTHFFFLLVLPVLPAMNEKLDEEKKRGAYNMFCNGAYLYWEGDVTY